MRFSRVPGFGLGPRGLAGRDFIFFSLINPKRPVVSDHYSDRSQRQENPNDLGGALALQLLEAAARLINLDTGDGADRHSRLRVFEGKNPLAPMRARQNESSYVLSRAPIFNRVYSLYKCLIERHKRSRIIDWHVVC